jgi:hypothetical protein
VKSVVNALSAVAWRYVPQDAFSSPDKGGGRIKKAIQHDSGHWPALASCMEAN